VGTAVPESAYLAADIEQSQLLSGDLDAGDFPFPQVVFGHHRVPRHQVSIQVA
jgi:hypothetical protein